MILRSSDHLRKLSHSMYDTEVHQPQREDAEKQRLDLRAIYKYC